MTFPSKFTNVEPVKSNFRPQYSIAQVAELTGTSEPTVRRWIAEGKLRAFRYSERVIRIDENDLLAMREEINPATYAHVNGGDA